MADLTKEDISNLTSSMADMTKAIERNNKLLLKQKDIFSNSRDVQKEIGKQIEKQEKDQKSLNENLKKENTLLENTRTLAGDIADNFTKMGTLLAAGGILAATGKLVRNAIDLDNVTTALSARMGKAVSKGELKKAVNNLQASIGASYEDAVALVTTLSENRYVDNIEEAAKGANLFSRATGVSAQNAAELTTQLNKGAGLSTKSINAMLTGMTKVQQNIGLSKSGMEAVTEYIKKGAVNMAAFGKTSTDIQRMANQTTALVAAMEKVGVAAGDATEIIDRLTDPDRIEDNILLYSQLGVSMEDALSGNVDLSNMDGQLKEMAQRIVDMGPIAGSQFAKSMGLSYKQASQMAKMEGNEVSKVSEAAMTAEDGALDTMKQLEAATEGFGKKVETTFNKIEGRIRKLPMTLIIVGGLALASLAKIVRKKFNEFVEEHGQPKQFSAITEAIGSSIGLGIKKGTDIAQAQALNAGKTIKRNIQQWFDASKLGEIFSSSEEHIDALVAKAKKQTFADIFYDASKQNQKAYFDQMKADMEDQKQNLIAQFNSISLTQKLTGNEKGRPDVTGDKNSERGKALNAIADKLAEINQLSEHYEKKAKKVAEVYTPDWLKKSEELAKLQKESEKSTNAYEQALQAVNKQKEREAAADNKLKQAEALRDALKAQGVSTSSAAYRQAQKDFLLAQAQLQVEKDSLEVARDAAIKAKETAESDKKAAAAVEAKMIGIQKYKGPLSALGKITHGIANNMKTAVRQKFDKTIFGQAYNTARSGGSKAIPAVAKGMAAGGKAIAVKGISGLAKGLGGILKAVGPMAIVMKIVGKFMEKIQEPLNDLIDGIMTFLEPVMKVMIGPISNALDQIAKALLPPMLKILGYTLKAIGAILTPIKLILKALSKLPIVGDAFKGVETIIEAVTGKDTTDAIIKAADDMSNSSGKLADAAKKQEDAADGQQEAAKISARGGDLTLVTAAKTNANPQASSTSVTTKENEVDSQLKEMENNKRKKKEDNYRATVEEKFNLLASKFDTLISILSQNNGPEFAVAGDKTKLDFETPVGTTGTPTTPNHS